MQNWMTKGAVAILVIGLSGLSGCEVPHTVTLRDGSRIDTATEPKLDGDSGMYVFKDRTGKKVRLNRDEVRKIEVTPTN